MKDTPTHAPTNKPTQNQFTNYELEQIEGMAKVICGNNRECKNCVHNYAIRECGCLFYAKRLFNENYRKQSVGEWADNHCTKCGKTPIGDETWTYHGLTPPRFELFMRFCPNCGARMGGGAE